MNDVVGVRPSLAVLNISVTVYVTIFQWLGLPLTVAIWWYAGLWEATKFFGMFVLTHFVLGKAAREGLTTDRGELVAGQAGALFAIVWGAVVAGLSYWASFHETYWVRASYLSLAVSAAGSPIRSLLHGIQFRRNGLSPRRSMVDYVGNVACACRGRSGMAHSRGCVLTRH